MKAAQALTADGVVITDGMTIWDRNGDSYVVDPIAERDEKAPHGPLWIVIVLDRRTGRRVDWTLTFSTLKAALSAPPLPPLDAAPRG